MRWEAIRGFKPVSDMIGWTFSRRLYGRVLQEAVEHVCSIRGFSVKRPRLKFQKFTCKLWDV